MASITTRAGKGSPLTNAELDANFNNINAQLSTAVITGGTIDGATIGATTATTGKFSQLDVDNLRLDGNTISSTDTNGNIILTPNGTGIATFSKATVVEVTDNTNAALRITQLGTGNALLVEDSSNPDATPFVITADGRIVSGATSLYPAPINTANTDKLQLNGATTYDSSADFISWATGTDTGASLNLARSDSGTIGTHTVAGSADIFGNVRFFGSDGTNFIEGAKISAGADGTPGTNDMPGRLVFSTTADGASTVTERMRIDSSGNVGIGTSSPTSGLQTAGSSSKSAFKTPNIAEVNTISATAATGTINYDTTTQSVLYYTTNASGNFTVNFRGSSGTSLNTIMSTGESISATFLVTNGATAYYNSAVQVDGSSVTPKWQGGTAPTSGNASSIDSYTYVIIKTGSAAFTVLASVTKFA
jgi:hypothetical protein